MTADDAFSSLMQRNALPIPLAKPSSEPQRVPGPAPAAPIGARTKGRDEAIKILDLMEGQSGDYNPRGDAPEEDGGMFNSPTETDLDPVGEGDSDSEIDNAHLHGARIVGRDVDPDEYYGGLDRTDYGDDGADDDGVRTLGGDAGLDRARQVRRFAYLPLAGMETFENRARDLLARLQSQDADRPSLAVTSPTRGEGQTELTIRLALAMAKRVDYRVLLADFDLRHPQLAARLGLSAKYFTLSDVLRGSCLLGEALLYSEEDNLYVLPARASDRDGDEFLNDGEVQALLDQVHRTFDFAVIGCGPMDHADAAIICRRAGSSALAGYCGFSRARALRDAADRLTEVGARVAGMLLTGA